MTDDCVVLIHIVWDDELNFKNIVIKEMLYLYVYIFDKKKSTLTVNWRLSKKEKQNAVVTMVNSICMCIWIIFVVLHNF